LGKVGSRSPFTLLPISSSSVSVRFAIEFRSANKLGACPSNGLGDGFGAA
jgi:hypothetical protein